MRIIFSFFVFLCACYGQEDNGDTDQIVFSRGGFEVPPGYEEVTTQTPGSIGALEKCGQGSDLNVHKCVPYYMCDGKTKTIVQSGKSDGFGIIDIRFGANSCDHPLDVCCKIPESGLPSVPPTPPDLDPDDQDKISPTPTLPISCGIRNVNGVDFKITGNKDREAEYGEFPWMVAILKSHYNSHGGQSLAICGGSLITPQVVLTGAHCVHMYTNSDIKVRAGEWDTQTEKERLPYQEREVVKIIIHNDFNPSTLFNDVALLILNRPFKKAEHISTICLPQYGQPFDTNHCFATGWGKDKFGREGQFQVILKKIELPIVPHDKCQHYLRTTRLGQLFNLDQSFTCAGGIQGRDTCTGDGGSPLVCPDKHNPSRYLQVGIVAWGIGCGEENIPGVYADVTMFRPWIDDHLQRLNFDTKAYNI